MSAGKQNVVTITVDLPAYVGHASIGMSSERQK